LLECSLLEIVIDSLAQSRLKRERERERMQRERGCKEMQKERESKERDREKREREKKRQERVRVHDHGGQQTQCKERDWSSLGRGCHEEREKKCKERETGREVCLMG
jgi:hypothetical protein